MLHLRLVVPAELTARVLAVLEQAPEVTNLWTLPGAARKPPGDLVSCDVAREEGTSLLDQLRELGIDRHGSIAIERIDASVSQVATAAERAAAGSPADAVVWEEVEGRVSESAELSISFLALMAIATMIAAVGILTDSIVLIIGAMVVGPEYGPLAGIAVAAVQRRPRLVLRSLAALAVGFPLAVAASAGLAAVLDATGSTRGAIAGERELTLFIAHPNRFSAIVAVLAGLAGMLSVISAKSGALIGVLISVTTIPAAANIGVAIVDGLWADAAGAAAQLAINLVSIVVSGVVVLEIAQGARRRRARLGSARRLR